MKTFFALTFLYIIPIYIYTALIGVPLGHQAALNVPVWVLGIGAAWLMALVHIAFLKLAIRGMVEHIQQAKRIQRSGY